MLLIFFSPFLVVAACFIFAGSRNWDFSKTLGFTSLIVFPYTIALGVITATM